ncbi:hypothetical protein HOLleu_03079 [Holothuria leucospilota]|uniref:Uncharacterized protein n=1 Tax=Holothuria leucospilota TaxID=206669 RepID=A0A9Q1CT82_HOLLE|nr:hypothetical protein HOLleu_03079 [Holothuria leucospilota]
MDLKLRVKKLEEENRALKEQLDIQDTVKQLKKAVNSQTVRTESENATEDEANEIEGRESFEHLRYKPSDAGALQECSVKGKRSRGKGKTDTRKPPLNPRGVNAIITCVLHKFKKTGDRAPALVAAMGTRLSELRADATSAHDEMDEDETQLFLVPGKIYAFL